jgi:hypothetical protein
MIFPIGPISPENDLASLKVQKAFQKTNWVQTIAPLADPHTYPSGINLFASTIHIHIQNILSILFGS